LFERLAVETETDIREAYQFGMPFGETTITDRNLLEIRRANLRNIRVLHVQPRREREFGYDWEWWVRVGQKPWIVMFLQAKKLNPRKGKYDALAHRISKSGKLQIDLLWQHAKELGGIPLYAFYNGPRPSVEAWNCRSTPDDQQFGCSIVPLHIVRTFMRSRRRRPKVTDFENLHENNQAVPWRCIVCASQLGAAGVDEAPMSLLASLANPAIDVREYSELPFYLQQVINTEDERVRILEYPESALMFPRHIAVILVEPPTGVAPLLLPAPQSGDLPSLLDIGGAKQKSKVIL
jgi:hypothetical protein